MIEVSLIEIALFCWGIAATGYAYKCKNQVDGANNFIRVLLSDEKVRDEIVADFEKYVQTQ